MYYFTDFHTHLQDHAFTDDLDAVISRAWTANVRKFVCNSTSPDDWTAVKSVSEKYSNVFPCFGVHPWFVENLQTGWEQRLEHILETTPSAIGEIGLDQTVQPRNDSLQEDVFRKQLEIARKMSLPVMLHTVKSVWRICEILHEIGDLPAILLHSFSGPTDRIMELVKLGCYFSFSATVLNPSSRRAKEAVASVPDNRILLESDSPFLAQQKGQRNEPSVISDICAEIATIRNMTCEQIERIVFENGRAFFSF